MKKIVIIDNIVYKLGYDISIGNNKTFVDGLYYGYMISSENPIIKEIDESTIPKYYFDQCFFYDASNTFSVIPEKENTIVEHFNNELNLLNNQLYKSVKYDKFINSNDNVIDTSQDFYNFINSKKIEIENNINSIDMPLYNYDNKLYSGHQLMNILKQIELFYKTCDDKYDEIKNYIYNTRNSYNNLDLCDSAYVISQWPATDQKMNLNGSISNIIENKFELEITVSKSIILADNNDTVDISFNLYYDEVVYTVADGISWFVPILNIDGNQADLLEIILTNGVGSVSWKTNTKGIYTIRMDLVRPIPKAKIPNNIEIIAK